MNTVLAARLVSVVAEEVGKRILRESVRLSGIRREPLASWTKDAKDRDVPELALNKCLMREAFLQLLASGLGALILVSATTVVLGGFSTKIKKQDFWYITAIGIIQAAKVVSSISGPAARFLVQFPAASLPSVIWTRQGLTEIGVAVTIVPILFAAAPIVAALTCLVLSINGLNATDMYGGFDTDPRRGNVKIALVVFYSLVLAQGGLFVLWSVAWMIRSDLTKRFSLHYFGNKTEELVDRYVTDTQDKCIEKGVFGTTNRTLVSFAAELLQSEHHSDHVSAVSVLRVLTTSAQRKKGAVEQICSSEQVVGSLFKLLRPKSPLDLETRVDTAEILTKLACNLRLTDIPGAAHSISSLLDPHPRLMKMAAKAGHPKPPAPRVTYQLNTAGCRWLLTELKKCVGLRANEGGGEPSRQGETQTQTNNTNQGEGGAEPQPIVETRINIANSDASEPAHRRPTYYSLCVKCSRWFLSRLLGSPLLNLISNIGGAEPSSRQEVRIQTSNTNEGGARDKPLIVHGLLILDELASDPGNCTEICKTTDLVPKILAPLTHGLLKVTGTNDPKTIQIVKASLRVVAKLTSGICESSSKLHREVVSESGTTAENIMWIMRNSSDQEMRILAVEILSKLTLGVPRMRGFIADLKVLLLDHQDSPLRVSAGKALSALAVNHRNREVIWEQVADDFPSLVTAMNDAGNSTVHRAVTAEFLAQICAKSVIDEDRMHRLSSVSNSLSMVLEAIVTTEIADMTTERRKFLASFFCLAVAIVENLATAQAFANAVRGLPMGEKLEEIIVEMTSENESEDVGCLVITKAAAKLVTWTTSSNPVYAHYFQRENIVDKLKDIVNAMGDLERCVILRGDADELEPPYETLQTVVEALESRLVAVLGPAGPAA